MGSSDRQQINQDNSESRQLQQSSRYSSDNQNNQSMNKIELNFEV